jgi:hypothetical protein
VQWGKFNDAIAKQRLASSAGQELPIFASTGLSSLSTNGARSHLLVTGQTLLNLDDILRWVFIRGRLDAIFSIFIARVVLNGEASGSRPTSISMPKEL